MEFHGLKVHLVLQVLFEGITNNKVYGPELEYLGNDQWQPDRIRFNPMIWKVRFPSISVSAT